MRKARGKKVKRNNKKGNSAKCFADSPGQYTNTLCGHGADRSSSPGCDC